jgi:hypothetical protein
VAVIVDSIVVLLSVVSFAKVGIQALETLLPVRSVLADPLRDLPQGPRPQPSWPPLRLAPTLDETSPFQDAQVLGDRGLGQRERRGQVLDRRLAGGEACEDRPSGGIG